MALQNFVDKVGPVVSSVWLNAVDILKFTIFADSTTKAQARTALTSDAPLEVVNGGTGQRTLDAVQAAFGISIPQTAAELSAGVTPTDLTYQPLDARRYGMVADGTTDDTHALEDAIKVAKKVVSGATEAGATITLPQGCILVSSQITLPNRVSLMGASPRGTMIKAAVGHTGGWVFKAYNPDTMGSMFDSRLENLTIYCNDVAGLGGVWAAAWQENSGMKNCVVWAFRTTGLKIARTAPADGGGMATCKLEQVEFFGSTLGADYGIEVQTISLVGGYVLTLDNIVIAGGNNTTGMMTAGARFQTDSVIGLAVHFENCTDGFLFETYGAHSLFNCSGSGTGPVVNVVHLDSGYLGGLFMVGCKRNSGTNFLYNGVTAVTITGGIPDPAIYVYPNYQVKTAPWTVNNLAAARTITCDTISAADLADIVGTLITDLKSQGIII